jgi:hypothetical protein
VQSTPAAPPSSPSSVPAAPTSPGESPAPGQPVTSVPAIGAAEDAELRSTISGLEARLAAIEAERTAATEAERAAEAARAAAAEAAPPAQKPRWQDVLDLKVWGYVQPQVVFSQMSEDTLTADGEALNKDRFLVRRGRIEVERFWKYAYSSIEVDLNTVNGPRVNLAGAEAAVLYPSPDGGVPYIRLGAGLADTPFGFELPDDADQREFMERSTASRAFFASDSDVGVQLSGGYGPLRYNLAALNGVPVSPDTDNTVYTSDKTLLGRLGFDFQRERLFRVSGGVTFLKGKGFHAGTPETKSQLLWSDVNQDGTVTLNELEAINGQAATESATFDRSAIDADLQLGVHTPLGWSRVYGEVTMGTNLDRELYVADPIATGYDLREVGWYVAIVQDVTKWGLVGIRFDDYQPAADAFEARRGLFLPQDASIYTMSPVVGVRIPDLAKLYLQYDYVVDFQSRDVRGEPVDLANDQLTVRAQVEF